jgi:hypothetical protein
LNKSGGIELKPCAQRTNMCSRELPLPAEESRRQRARCPENLREIGSTEAVFSQQEGEQLKGSGLLKFRFVRRFPFPDKCRQSLQIVVLVLGEIMTRHGLGDRQGRPISVAGVNRARQQNIHAQRAVILREVGKGDQSRGGGFHSVVFQRALSYSAWVRNLSAKIRWWLK